MHPGRAQQSRLPRAGRLQDERPEHPGFPDKRWLTLAELKAAEGLQVADIKTKLAEYQAATQAAADAELDAALAPAPAAA